MKQVTTITRAIGLLEKMYRLFNERCFNGRLHDCTITIERKKCAYGCYWVHPQYYINGDKANWKIALNPEHFYKPVDFVAAVLLHEMCHHAAVLDGVQDCSRGGTYHNKRFKAYAESTGLLNVEKDDRYGWTVTTPNDEMLLLCAEQDYPEFQISEKNLLDLSGLIPPDSDSDTGNAGGSAPSKSNSRKHVCPCCGAIARTTKDIPLICGLCRVDMTME